MVSAYKDPVRRQIVLVCIDMTTNAMTLPLAGLTIPSGHFARYTTTKTLPKSVVPAGQIQLEPKSVVTLVGSYE